MPASPALRLVGAFATVLLLSASFGACGARSDATLEEVDAGAGACVTLGGHCSGAEAKYCCENLLCKGQDGTCKPPAICKPDGKSCTLTTDCCSYDCISGYCGGVA